MLVLDKLWSEGLHPSEQDADQTLEYQQAVSRMADLADALMKEMTVQQKDMFEAFSLAKAELDSLDQKQCFIEAFRLGMRLMLDILT